MNAPDRRLKTLRRLALLCSALVLAITSLSAYIRLERAGLSCAGWPQCYGERLRNAQQGIPASADDDSATTAARLAHRVIASVTLLLVVTMLVVALAARPVRRADAGVALALLVLALALAVLGRWSSDARVPAVAIGNLLGGFAMFALCWRLARGGDAALSRRARALAACGVALLAAQVALGGLLSASFAATSCASFTECVSAMHGVPWSALDPWREPVLAGNPPTNASGALIQVLHRIAGLAVAVVVAAIAIVALRQRRRLAGALLLALLGGALAAGIAIATRGPTLALALLHNLAAALMFATLFELTRAPRDSTPRQPATGAGSKRPLHSAPS